MNLSDDNPRLGNDVQDDATAECGIGDGQSPPNLEEQRREFNLISSLERLEDVPSGRITASNGNVDLVRFQTTSNSFLPDLSKSSPETTTTSKNRAHGGQNAMETESSLEASPWLDQAFAKYGKVVKLQDRFLTDQSRLKSERDTVLARFHSLKESLVRYQQLTEASGDGADTFSFSAKCKAAYDQLSIDGQAFDNQMHLVIKLEQSLGKLEYRLGELLPDLLDLIGPYFQRRAPKESISDSPPESRAPSPHPSDPLENEYYDKRGDVRILRDRLFNHFSQLQGVAQDSNADAFTSTCANPPTQVTEDSALRIEQSAARDRWQVEHEELQNDLHEAEKQLKHLWDACQDARIDVGELSIQLSGTPKAAAQSPKLDAERDVVQLDAPPFLTLDPRGIVSRFLKDFSWPERGAFISPTSVDDSTEKREFIENWIGKISDTLLVSGVEPTPAAEFAHDVSTPRNEPTWLLVNRVPEDVCAFKDEEALPTEQRQQVVQQREPQRILRRSKSDSGPRRNTRRNSTSSPDAAEVCNRADWGRS